MAPMSSKIPIASPAFPPALIPPELGDKLAVAVADAAVADTLDVVELEVVAVAAAIARELPTVVDGDKIAEGRPVDVASVVCFDVVDFATGELALAATFVGVDCAFEVGVSVGCSAVGFASGVVVIGAAPTVEYPPIAPSKVGAAVT